MPQTSAAVVYQGDKTLAALLQAADSAYRPDDVRGVLAGILAAPEAVDLEGRWLELIAPKADPRLNTQLQALKTKIAGDLPKPGAWVSSRIDAFRAELARRDLAGYLLPRGDEHQGEYVAPYAERLSWLTGFTGSAGLAIVLIRRAALFTDGRYTLQAQAQLDTKIFEIRHVTDQPPAEWIGAAIGRGERIGYDPRLHTPEGLARLRSAIERAGGQLVPTEDNAVDSIWADRPPSPISPAIAHDLKYAGRSSAEKRAELADRLVKDGHAAAVISDPASVAWLLNIRGGDVPHTPLALSFAILNADATVDLFIDPRKLMPGVAAHLGNGVRILPPDRFAAGLDALGKKKNGSAPRVLTDMATGSIWITGRLEAAGAVVVRGTDICALPKAKKNAVELQNTRDAHVRDGAALTRFLAWLAKEAPKGQLGEIAVSDRLLAFRRECENFRDTSFDTISGAGPNGAIVHYRAMAATERRLAPDMLYLVDSGAQFPEGTTDVTRTVVIGRSTSEQKDRFTRVLKGHIALAQAQFPRGTSGSQLDALARQSLWDVGLDYDHGTGHGVGSFLSVHEGPQRISKIPSPVALEPGMIVSNEPGYYKTGEYGIRIENLVAVREADAPGAERPMLCFETLTLAPIDRDLIEPSLLSPREIAWLDAYHARVRGTLGPLVDKETAAWLEKVTQPLGV